METGVTLKIIYFSFFWNLAPILSHRERERDIVKDSVNNYHKHSNDIADNIVLILTTKYCLHSNYGHSKPNGHIPKLSKFGKAVTV